MKKNFAQEIRLKWFPRKKTSHKGDFGRVFILAGSRGMTGAASLAALAALRTGAGVVTLGVPEAVYPVVARRNIEVMTQPFASTPFGSFSLKGKQQILKELSNQDVFLMGPGLSKNSETQALVRWLTEQTSMPLVLDADGLNAFAGYEKRLSSLSNRSVLTPHPGEFKRIFGGKLDSSSGCRQRRASEAARKWKLTIVLKGSGTVVADSNQVYVNQTGNPGMATAGTGDVLAGIIAGLIAQGFSLWDASCFSVYLHGLAGDLAAKKLGEASLIAGDILEFLPQAIKKVRGC